MRRALLYLRTARHLRWRQWVYRPVRRVQRLLPAAPAAALRVDEVRAARMAEAVAAWGPGDAEGRIRRAEEVCAGRFTFLNHTEALPSPDWRRRHVGHLWSYNLHYFDYALDLAWAFRLRGDPRFARRFEELAEGWIAATADGAGDGWEPYPLSLRTVNWTQALLLFGDALGSAFRERLTGSLARQLATLERRLEWHILANHLQKNLCALATGGLLFEGAAAERWRRVGLRHLWREVEEQVLPDGGHFERSPMYHAIALGDLLELLLLLRACGEPAPPAAVERIGRMADAFDRLSRPDGSLHLLNDSAGGIAPARDRLDALARAALGHGVVETDGVWELPQTGFLGYTAASTGERLIVDCGAPGPPYQPGHAHCGLLGFELDLGGRSVFVDSGVSGYDGDPFREYVRSTRAHNTVAVAGREQSEVWGTFRLARRAVVLYAQADAGEEGCRIRAAYRPFHERRIVHHRTVERGAGDWTVTDRVEGAEDAPLQSYLHLHPEAAVVVEDGGITARLPGVTVHVEPFGTDRLDVVRGARDPVQGWYCPEFGCAVPAAAIEMHVERNNGGVFGYRIRTIRGG
ncbi:MAG TPA: alginate lyase family protein [Longimicrobiaceae bacterium]|nr:alginate lyase family protein [Longimicrobiaceae bacterium]